MEEVSCTQNDLMQVMQKLLNERKKVKTLEQEVLHLRQDSASPLTSSQNSDNHTKDAPLVEEKSTTHELLQATEDSAVSRGKIEHKSEQEIQLLKKIIKELACKLKEQAALPEQTLPAPPIPEASIQTAPVSSSSSQYEGQDSPTWQLKQSLYLAQNEIRQVKEHSSSLEEEIRRLGQFRNTIQAELKEQKIKVYDGELAKQAIAQDFAKDFAKLQETYKGQQAKLEEDLRQANEGIRFYDEEIKRYRQKVAELSESLSKKEALFTSSIVQPKELQLSNDLLETRKKLERLVLALEDQQLLFHEISEKNKDLEIKSAKLATEKQVAQAQLQETSKVLTQKDILYKEIIREKEMLLGISKQIEQELKEQKHLHTKAESEIKKINEQNHSACVQIAELEKKCELLAEKEVALEQAKQKNVYQENDYKNQIELLEQHLIRKVKECAELTHSYEEQEQAGCMLKSKLSERESKIEELSSELINLMQREKETVEQAAFANEDQENRLSAQYELMQNQAQEIASLKKIEEKYLVLEQLLGHISSTISTVDQHGAQKQNEHTQNEIKAIHIPQNNFPLQKPVVKEAPKPQPKQFTETRQDLFMGPKDKAVRHDFFQ